MKIRKIPDADSTLRGESCNFCDSLEVDEVYEFVGEGNANLKARICNPCFDQLMRAIQEDRLDRLLEPPAGLEPVEADPVDAEFCEKIANLEHLK